MKKVIHVEEIDSIFVVSQEKMTEVDYDSMLMVGSSNWDAYVLKRPSCEIIAELKEVLFLTFDNKEDLGAYVQTIPDTAFLDFSYEHETPCLLQFKV